LRPAPVPPAALLALSLMAGGLLGADGPAPGEPVTFQQRAAPRVGQAWHEAARWATTGHTTVHLGPVKVRDRAVEDELTYACGVQVGAVEADRPSQLGIGCTEARRVEGDDQEDLGIAGLDVIGLGLGEERDFLLADGGRLKRKQKGFFERAFGDPGDKGDPVDLLLPAGPVQVGASWDLSMDRVVDYFGRERFELDAQASRGRATLIELVEHHGHTFGRIDFDVAIVPAAITDGEFEAARMLLAGTAELPLAGDVPYRALDLEVVIRFKGTVRRKAITAHLDIDTVLSGSERKQPGA
jgi:hypothetical protein